MKRDVKSKQHTQKIYCFVDESGQDINSSYFIVVSVFVYNPDTIRALLLEIEKNTGVGIRKWRNSFPQMRLKYLKEIISRKHQDRRHIFYGTFKKPLPYFFPYLEVLDNAILGIDAKKFRIVVYIDGIDHKKATELTNALRARGHTLARIRSVRDESEPLIRLADRWAGCLRRALGGYLEEKSIVLKAEKNKVLINIEKSP